MTNCNNCTDLHEIRLRRLDLAGFRFGPQSAYRDYGSEKEIDNNMNHFRSFALAAFAGCISFALLPSLQADEWNKKTTLKIDEPIQVPSCCTPDHTVTLQPGEYVIVLVDSLSDRHIVRIFDKDQQHVITTILAIPNYRLQPTGKTVFQFWEVPAGEPRALRAWFYPGDNFGQEFAYHQQTATQIAAFVKTPVPAVAVDTTAEEDLKTAPLVAVDETGKAADLPVTVPLRTPEPPVQVAMAFAPETPAPAQPAPETLPHTASTMPLLGLAGLVSLALFAALGVRSWRRRPSKA